MAMSVVCFVWRTSHLILLTSLVFSSASEVALNGMVCTANLNQLLKMLCEHYEQFVACTYYWSSLQPFHVSPGETTITVHRMTCPSDSSSDTTQEPGPRNVSVFTHLGPFNATKEDFAEWKELRTVRVHYDAFLTTKSIREIFSVPSLTSVSLIYCNVPSMPSRIFRNIASNVGSVSLDNNPYTRMYFMDAFCDLRFLRSLSLRACSLRAMTSSCPLRNLSTLDLTDNALTYFRCSLASNETFFPALSTLILKKNNIHMLRYLEKCLPSLTYLDMSYNFITVYDSSMFTSPGFPHLKKLVLHHQSRPRYWETSDKNLAKIVIHNYTFSHEHLEELDLSHNKLNFSDGGNIESNAFANCSGLRHLNLNSNDFTFVDDERFLELFGRLHSLVSLSVSSSQFRSVSSRTFANFRNLTALHLDNNMIAGLPDGTFDSLHRLTALFLDNNKIRTISEHTFSSHLRESLSKLTLSFNPFLCSCDILWFAHWYRSEEPKFLNDSNGHDDCSCQNIPGMPLVEFSLPEQACLLSHESNVLLIQFCSLFIISLTLASLVFRYRWQIRLLMYDVFRGRRRILTKHYDFDVFVCHASEDLLWVRHQLMPKVENDLGLRLCVHERDFILGCHIVDNIVQCVEKSKKILMVFSTHFVRSEWCQFELALCLTHVLEQNDALIVVCLDDVTSRQMTSAMRAVVKTTTYIQWREEEEDAVASFWGRLRLGLQEILRHDEHV